MYTILVIDWPCCNARRVSADMSVLVYTLQECSGLDSSMFDSSCVVRSRAAQPVSSPVSNEPGIARAQC